jgi:receptor expression-enhancing protein 1/2/3/4
MVRTRVFGLPPSKKEVPPPTGVGYAQSLLQRFSMPTARPGVGGAGFGGQDLYGMLSSTLGSAYAGGAARDGHMSASGALIPENIQGKDEKLSYISAQRDRLRTLMSAFDREASSIATSSKAGSADRGIEADVDRRMREMDQSDGLRKSKSELEFESVDHDVGTVRQGQADPSQGGSWMPWGWGARTVSGVAMGQGHGEGDMGASSGVDVRR